MTDFEYIANEISKRSGIPLDHLYVRWLEDGEMWIVEVSDPEHYAIRLKGVFIMQVGSDDDRYSFDYFGRDDKASVEFEIKEELQ